MPSRIHPARRVPLSFMGSLGRDWSLDARRHNLPHVRRMTLGLRDLPKAWDGLRILQISDVHAGPFAPIRRLREIRDMGLALRPDLVVFTGDQLDRRPSDAEVFMAGFSGIEAPLGAWGILGNHDHTTHPVVAVSALEGAGIEPLVNRGVTFTRDGFPLSLVGVDDLSSATGGPRFEILREFPGAFRICLCHQPGGWPQALGAGAHLTLAGHTHGGQIAINTRNLNVARVATRYIAGPYRRDDALLYVSRGVGVGAVPVRFGAPPEIDLITLRRTAQTSSVAA
jgi:predicted MPP superfamily phosphohydrolase